MKLSLNIAKWFLDFELPSTEEITARIGAQLGEIEGIEKLGQKYDKALVVKVLSSENHPNADRLHVCAIDDGGGTPDVKRDENGHIQVVCGAPNVHADMLAVWLPPGAIVPDSYGKEQFVLEARELRGVVSNGMLASPKELALGDGHEGILEIEAEIKPGTPFTEALDLKDEVIIDIENKMFTHRPDCFGFLGVARELSGIFQKPFHSPDWYVLSPVFPEVGSRKLGVTVTNELPELVPRFTMVAISDVNIGPSPLWLIDGLARLGHKSINNIVDYTNWYMLETGQPLHAYDYDKVKALTGGDKSEITVRFPKPGEKVRLLNGKEIEPRPEAIMISSGDHLIGMGGVMGGADTEVDEATTNIILEAATFDMYSVRRTSMAHGLFTDAVSRFNKGQSPLQNLAVLSRISREICEHAGGNVAGDVVDLSQVKEREWVHPPVPVTSEFINARLGLKLSAEDMKKLLENVEMAVVVEGDKMTVTAPFWRTDIETREDVVEEVGRLYGYDHLPLELPSRSIKPVAKDELLQLKDRVRQLLIKSGANEVLTYSFVHGELLKKAGQDPAKAFRVSNALSPDLQYYRLSLTPSLLDKIHPNIKAGYDKFALFEIGKGHNVDQVDDDGLPLEFEMLDVVCAANDKSAPAGAAYYQARAYLLALAAEFGTELELRPINKEEDYQVAKPYDHTRAAQIFVKGTDIALGMIGEYKASVRRNFKLPVHTAGFGIGLLQLLQALRDNGSAYSPLSRFPSVHQDLTLRVASDTAFSELVQCVDKALGENAPDASNVELEPLGIYQAKGGETQKNVSFRVTITGSNRTLTDQEVAKVVDAVAAAAHDRLAAARV